jgi:type I restriction enzyme R subunit
LYEPPFSNLHAGGPDALFTGRDTVIEGIFAALASLRPDNHADQAIGG